MTGTQDTGSVSVTLDLRVGARPIEGSLRAPDRSPSSFRGWLELTALLQTLSDGEGGGSSASRASREAGVPEARAG